MTVVRGGVPVTGWLPALLLLLPAQAPVASVALPASAVDVEIVLGGSGVPAVGADLFLIDERAIDQAARTDDYAAGLSPEWSARHGTALAMDERGRVRAPRGVVEQRLVAYRDGWSGRLDLAGRPSAGQLLELWPDGGLEVEVVDAAGRAVASIPVRLMRDEANATCGHHWPGSIAKGVTDASGVARLPNARAAIAKCYDADGVSRFSVAWVELVC